MLDETVADDSDYIYSPENPTASNSFEVLLGPLLDPLVSTGHVISYRLKAVNLDITWDLAIVQGTTVLDSWTEVYTVADGLATRTRTLSGAVADSITDYTDVRFRGDARE
jgi:hypothetical protein